jgi:hypothetical protein
MHSARAAVAVAASLTCVDHAGRAAAATPPHHHSNTLAHGCSCILSNKEPFAHKDWRKEPYEPRPYVELQNYAITSNVPAEVRLGLCTWQACRQEWRMPAEMRAHRRRG